MQSRGRLSGHFELFIIFSPKTTIVLVIKIIISTIVSKYCLVLEILPHLHINQCAAAVFWRCSACRRYRQEHKCRYSAVKRWQAQSSKLARTSILDVFGLIDYDKPLIANIMSPFGQATNSLLNERRVIGFLRKPIIRLK